MDGYEAIKQAAEASGVSLIDASRSMGKRDNYISNKRGASVGIDIYAGIMDALGYALVAVPVDQVPAGALVITSRGTGDMVDAVRRGLEEGEAVRRRLEEGTISEAMAGAIASSPGGAGFRAVPKDQTD